jgi:hypothetical protein
VQKGRHRPREGRRSELVMGNPGFINEVGMNLLQAALVAVFGRIAYSALSGISSIRLAPLALRLTYSVGFSVTELTHVDSICSS